MTPRLRRVPGTLFRLLLLSVIFVVLLRWFEHRNVFQPTATLWAGPDRLGRPFEEVWLEAGDGPRLNAWFFPAATNSPRRDLALLHCHGNGGNLSHRLEVFAALLETGVNLLGFDYRGYGRSSGRPSEAGTYVDAQTAYAWLRGRGFAATNIIALGESLGGGVASELAARETLRALILQSTFTSIPDIGSEIFPWLPVRTLGTIQYDTRAKLSELRIPVLVLHGRADTVVPFHHGQRLWAAAHEPKRFHELAGDHNDFIEVGRAEFLAGIERFLRFLEAPATWPEDAPL